jgi:S-adenosylmethionine-dependent methyltransferase
VRIEPFAGTIADRLTRMTAETDTERFLGGADKYAAYLATPEGRLRIDLAFANLQEFLPQPQAMQPLRALDLGCGTGETAVRLARLGVHVTLLDSSSSMLDIAKRAAGKAGVIERFALKQGDAAQAAHLFPARSFDLIVCHNLLEYVDDPAAVVGAAAQLMGNSSATVSILARNQAGEAFKAAIQAGDLAAAEHNLTAEWGRESLYGGSVRLFTTASLQAMLTAASLTVVAKRGVRVISDYLPPQVSRSAEYQRIFELERQLGSRPEFAAVARYTHCLARCAGHVKETQE